MAHERWILKGCKSVADLTQGNSLVQHWEGPYSEYADWLTSGQGLRDGWTNLSLDADFSHKAIDGTITEAWLKIDVTFGTTGASDPNVPPDTTSPDYGHISGPIWTRSTNKVQTTPEDSPNGQLLNQYTTSINDTPWASQIVIGAQTYRTALETWQAEVQENPSSSTAKPVPVTNPDDLFPPAGATTALKALALQFYDMLIRHPDINYSWDQPVLRKTDTVASYAKLAAVSTNAGRFFTTGALISAEPSLDGIGLIGLADLSSLYWQKQSPEVEEVSGGIYQIVQEYWGYVTFERFLYGDPIT